MVKGFIIIFWLMYFCFAEGFSQQVTMVSMRDKSEAVSPGKTITLSYAISNTGKSTLQTRCQPRLPAGWRCLGCDSLLTLQSLQKEIRLMTLYIPERVPGGKYRIDFEVINSDGIQLAAVSNEILVKNREIISIESLEVPEYVQAGNRANLLFLITNGGNSVETIILQCTNADVKGPETLSIPADSAVMVGVEVVTNPNTVFHQLESVTIKALKSDSSNFPSREVAYKTVQYQVIPNSESTGDPYHRFPIDFKISYMGVEKSNGAIESGLQLELSGQGSLDDRNEHRIDFRFRGPDRFYLASMGNYDEYFVNYYTRGISVFVGDQFVSSTRLTEYSRYGRGLQFRIDKEKFGAGCFYIQARFTPDIKEERGAWALYHTGKLSYIKASVLNKVPGIEFLPATLYSLETHTLFSEALNLDVEVSSGTQAGKTGNGALLGISGSLGILSYNAQVIYTDKYYAGYYRNSRFFNTSLKADVTKKVGLNVNYSRDERNPELDTLMGTAPSYNYLLGGVSFLYGNRNLVNFQAGYHESSDKLALNTFHYRDNKIRMSVNQYYKNHGLYIESELAQTNNIADNVTGTSWSCNANLNLFILRSLYFDAFAGYYNTYRYTYDKSSQWIYGGGIKWNYKSVISLDARVQNDYSPEDYSRDRNLMQMMLTYRPALQHELVASVRRTLVKNTQNREDMAFSLTYVYHIGMPVKKIKHLGIVSGRILNLGVDKVQGIVVKLDGHTTITDENGYFRFADVKPDSYYLMIDPSTTRVNYIPDRKTPILVSVEADTETAVEFGLVKAGKIEGHLVFPETHGELKNVNEPVTKGKKRTILIEISNGEEVYRKLIDEMGNYTFLNVRPGKWKIKFFAGNNLDDFTFMQKEYTITLAPDQVYPQNIFMVKKQRKVKFQEEPVKVQYR